jgi:aminoglycoside 6'-N-acetyltransferase I
MRIIDFAELDTPGRAQAARILREALAHSGAYGAPGAAEAEVAEMDEPERFGFAALAGETLAGWIGAIRAYSHSLELHPLVVDPPRQGKGVGAALVAALEAKAVAEGALALHLGADDEFGGTSLAGVELFPDVLVRAAEVTASPRHPLGFYRRQGFEVVGLIPHANGFGKPDILLSKRLVAAV